MYSRKSSSIQAERTGGCLNDLWRPSPQGPLVAAWPSAGPALFSQGVRDRARPRPAGPGPERARPAGRGAGHDRRRGRHGRPGAAGQNATDRFDTWAYAWALVLLAGARTGRWLVGVTRGRRDLVASGGWLIAAGLGGFLVL